MVALLPMAFVLLSILIVIAVSELGFDLGVGYTGSASESGEPFTWGIAIMLGWMTLGALYGFVAALILFFLRFSYGRVTDSSAIEFRPLIGRWQQLRIADISGYSNCSFPSWSRRYDRGQGVTLYLANGSHVEINDLQLHGILEFVDILKQRNVRWFGTETTLLYPFMKRRYKFDPR